MSYAFVAALARAITDKAKAERSVSQLLPATVKKFNPASGRDLPTADVHITGDPAERTLQVTILTGQVTPGQTVMVMFDPPEGAYTWGEAPVVVPPVTGWTISAGNNDAGEGAYFVTTTTYEMDQDDNIVSITIEGLNSNISTVDLIVRVNGAAAATISLPITGGVYSDTFDIGYAVVSGDVIEFELIPTVDAGETLTVSQLYWSGLIPMLPDAIGSGNEYEIHTIARNFIGGGSTIYDFDDLTFSGTDSDLTVPDDSYSYTSTTVFGDVEFPIVGQIYGKATPDLSTEYTIQEVGFTGVAAGSLFKSITGNVSNYTGVAGFSSHSDTIDSSSPGTFTFSWSPEFVDNQSSNTSSAPVNVAFAWQIFSTYNIISAVLNMAGDHAPGSIEWTGGG